MKSIETVKGCLNPFLYLLGIWLWITELSETVKNRREKEINFHWNSGMCLNHGNTLIGINEENHVDYIFPYENYEIIYK